MASTSEGLTELLSRHELAALLHIDFHDHAERAHYLLATSTPDEHVELLRTAQRLARVVPLTDAAATAIGFEPHRAVAGLVGRGLTSAHHIAEIPESVFAEEHAGVFGGEQRLAREAHRRAVQVRAAVRHAVANVRDLASPHVRALHGSLVEPGLQSYIESVPGYQELFGRLDYVGCEHCGSVFGPAAYLFDLLRICERYITKESRDIPRGQTLRERRPDLFSLPLTCECTNTPVPAVVLVDDVLKQCLGSGAVRDLATAVFPFDVPYNEPRTRLTGALARLGVPLPAGAAALLARDPDALIPDALPLAAAALGLSPETVRFVTTPRTADADVAAEYGLTALAGHLPAPGPGTITVEQGGTTATGGRGELDKVLAVGQQFSLTLAGKVEIRTVTEIVDAATVRVDGAWPAAAANASYVIYPVQDLSTVRMFRERTGLAEFDQLTTLFEQGLSDAEQQRAGDSLWVNATGESLPNLRVSSDIGGDLANPVWRIAGLSAKRLDRLSRLLRLSRAVGVPVDVLDWLIVQGGVTAEAAQITPELLIRLAGLRRLADATHLPLVNVAAFAYPLKTIGRGTEKELADPFDVIFNAVSVRRGADPYAPGSPIPFDPARPLAWPVAADGDWIANEGTTSIAPGDTLQLAEGASSRDGAYVGLAVTITSGEGKGQRAVIKTYDGASRLATLYTPWSVSDPSCTYAISAVSGIAERLSAALRVRGTDLRLLGAHLGTIPGSVPGDGPGAVILLTLDNLTALWRLTTMAATTGLSIDALLTLLRVLKLPAESGASAVDGPYRLETILTASAWLAQNKLTVYEVDYILNGTPSRYLRLGYDPVSLPAAVAAIAGNGSGTLLTVETLVRAGFDEQDAGQLRGELKRAGFIDRLGIVLPARGAFQAAAILFPIAKASLTRDGLTEAEADAALAELRRQYPSYLAPARDGSVLTWNYRPGAKLAGLFEGFEAMDAQRAIVSGVLDGVEQRVSFTEFAGLAPVTVLGFVTGDIGPEQSRAVYKVLTELEPPVLKPAGSDGAALLSACYSRQTLLPDLFVSPAKGQRAAITGYSGESRIAVIDGSWQVVPDAFTAYEVCRQVTTGTAVAATETSIRLQDSASERDGEYVGDYVVLTGGPARADRRRVAAYQGSTRTCIVDKPWTTEPTRDSGYLVERIVTRGSACGGTADTITLAPSALPEDGAYEGCALSLVPDPDVTRKSAEVRDALAATAERIEKIRGAVAQARDAQNSHVAQALGAFLGIAPPRLGLLLPMAVGRFTFDDDLPGLLTPPIGGTVPGEIATLAERLVRTGLAAGKAGLDADALAGATRRPDHFGLDGRAFSGVETWTFETLRLLTAVPAFVKQSGISTESLVSYLSVWEALVGEAGKRAALATLIGRDSAQIEIIARRLKTADFGWAGIDVLPGLTRLLAPFAALDGLAADAGFLLRVAQAALLPSLTGGAGDDVVWATYQTIADETLELVPARFGNAAPTVIDELGRDLAVATRDALLGYAIVSLRDEFPGLRSPVDLIDYLLLDVETSGCDTTSRIAQAIASVQLYMQRVRLGLEPGASAAKIRDAWWDWISTYRMWEANRRVFLYPENYIDPSLRRGASPEFSGLIDELLQGRPTDEHVAKAVTDYFEAVEDIATLAHVGAYKLADEEREAGQTDQQSYLVARTRTTPYTYYVRAFTRSLLRDSKKAGAPTGESIVWQPWRKVEATIDSPDVAPVVAFDRLFLFWNEIEPTKGSRVGGSGGTSSTKTESSWTATLNYTFRGASGAWFSAQQLGQPQVIRVMPGNYQPAAEAPIKQAYSAAQAYWSRPYAQQIPYGLPALGALTFTAGGDTADGAATAFTRQVQAGDCIWVAGRTYEVDVVLGDEQLRVTTPFETHARGQLFKVIPADRRVRTFPAFRGPGSVYLDEGPTTVVNTQTSFSSVFSVGDGIQLGGETRTVIGGNGGRKLTVDREWSVVRSTRGDGLVTMERGERVVTGIGDTKFASQVKVGYGLIIDAVRYTVVSIQSDKKLTVSQPCQSRGMGNVQYLICPAYSYTAIPRTRGDERLMVLYGPNLDVTAPLQDPSGDGQQANDTDDPFIADCNEFNLALYDALKLVHKAKDLPRSGPGDVAGQSALVLGRGFDEEKVGLLARGSASARDTSTTPAVRVALDSENDVVFAREESRLLLALYWGNNASGATQNQCTIGKDDRPLAYHVDSGTSSLYGYGNQIGWYLLDATGQSFWIARDDIDARTVGPSAILRRMAKPADAKSPQPDMVLDFGAYTTASRPLTESKYRFTRLTTSVVPALKQRLLVGGFPLLFSLESQTLQEPPFSRFYQVPGETPPPAIDAAHLPPDTMDFDGAYGPYFWEVFFHVPLLVAGQLSANQNFAEAKRWYEYIFNPQAERTQDETGDTRYWRFRPFREGMTLPGLRDILQNQFEITTYNDDPFNPDAIARLRISAYAKATVLKYVDNLIRWADALFRQDTRESVAQATNLYLLASQLLGRRPEQVGTLPRRAAQSFDEIADRYSGDIPQFLLELENSSLIPVSGEGRRYADVPINDVNAYFCVPENAELTGYWDTVEDRLFKIRHCLDIDGVERRLALFAPPIDVRGLVAAYGAGGVVGGLAGPSAVPIPNLRFTQIVAYARSLTEDVVRLGSALLSALERRDAEALATLQLTQEGRVLELTGAIRRQQIDLVARQREALTAARESAAHRGEYYRDLISAGLNGNEIGQFAMLAGQALTQSVSAAVRTAAAISFTLPQLGSLFGITYGGQQFGHSTEQWSAAMDATAQSLGVYAEIMGLNGQYSRRSEDWELQRSLADFDLAQFDAQLAANETDLAIAESELTLSTTRASQNTAVGEYYRTKFTNEALYSWLANRLSGTYFQTYALALDLARAAQRALQYELRTDVSYVSAGAWDDLRRGLTAGESLMLALDRLESAYATAAVRTFEITKTISLAALDPVAFLRFQKTGEATFSFDEALFDADFPGHYRRRIKTLSVSIPALVGPYQNVRATLTQTANRVVLRAELDAVRFLLGDETATVAPNVIEHNVRAHQSIAVSLGQGDSGLFQVDLDDPLLLPFEQTGAVSNWLLSMPPSTNPIDLTSVADVVFELKYTALDGGAAFRSLVADLPRLRQRTWSRTTQAARQEADAWRLFMTGPVAGGSQILTLRLSGLTLPNTAQPRVTGFFLRLVVEEGAKTTSRNPYVTLTLGDADQPAFSPDANGTMLVALDSPVTLPPGPLEVTVDFNVAAGYAPPDLVDDERLSPQKLLDVELVLFLAGEC